MKYYLEKDLKKRNQVESEAKVLLLQENQATYAVNK
jgi:hypothetical protein